MRGTFRPPSRSGSGRGPLWALISGDSISIAGNTLTMVAVPWFVLQTTASAALTGVAGSVLVLPNLISGLFGGPLVDRLGHRKVRIVSDLASGLTVAAIPVLHLSIILNYPILLMLIFLGTLLHWSLHMIFILPVFWLHTSGGLRELFWSLDRYTQRPHGIFTGWVRKMLVSLLPFALIGYFVAIFLSFVGTLGRSTAARRGEIALLSLTWLLQFGAILREGRLVGGFPLTNTSRYLLVLGWVVLSLHLLVWFRQRVDAAGLVLPPLAFLFVIGAAGFLVLGAVAVRSARTYVWRAVVMLPLLWTVLVSATSNRGALLTAAVGIAAIVAFAPRSRNWLPVLAATGVFAAAVVLQGLVAGLAPAAATPSTTPAATPDVEARSPTPGAAPVGSPGGPASRPVDGPDSTAPSLAPGAPTGGRITIPNPVGHAARRL